MRIASGGVPLLVALLFGLILALPAAAAVLPDGGPNPTFLRNVDGRLFFATYAAESGGWQLWITDPSSPAPTLLRDSLGFDVELASAGRVLVFSTRGALWTSDGTPEGTRIVKELPFYPYGIKPRGHEVYFSNGRGQLWKSDLTSDGTTLVADIPPGFVFHDLTPAAITQGAFSIFFRAIDATVGNELWVTDGTPEGTQPIDLQPNGGSNPGQMLHVGGTQYFSANGGSTGYELWKSDGTVPGTVLVKDINPGGDAWPMQPRVMDGIVYFRADDGTGAELWRTDGTADGTWRVADINPHGGSYPNGFLVVDDMLYFRADDGTTGTELWRTKGTPETTELVADVNPFGGSKPANLRLVRGQVVFTADDGTHGEEPWKFIPATGAVQMIADLNPYGGSYPHDLIRIGGSTVYFAADDGVGGTQLWRMTCTGAPLHCDPQRIALPAPDRAPHGVPYLVRDVFPGPGDSAPYDLTPSGGRLFFRAFHPEYGNELWVSDGTEDGTHLVRDIAPGPDDGSPYSLTDVSGRLFFTAYAGEQGTELWTSDGTDAGTHLVRDITPGWQGSNIHEIAAFGDRAIFQAYRADVGVEPWISDGTDAGTVLLDLNPGDLDSYAHAFTPAGDLLYFVAVDDEGPPNRSRTKLWISDGTVAGSEPIMDFRRNLPAPDLLTAAGDSLVFRAEGSSLYRVDGTTPHLIVAAGRPEEPVAVGDAVFFTLRTDAHGRELWVTEGDGARLVKDIHPGPDDGMPGRLTNVGGTLMFWATDGRTGFELWKSDGTEEGTVLVRDVDPTDVTVPSFFKAVGNVLFFSGHTPSFGYELWRSDGTTAGTSIVRNINPIASSYPESLAALGGTLFFYAEDNRTGEELWAVTPCGNGAVDPGETCDDGDTDGGDGCDGMCRIEPATTTSATSTTSTSTTTTTTSSSSTTTVRAATTTTTMSPSTTTTTSSTLPRPVELCGNCLDDDGDGLVDLADPACCVADLMSLVVARVTADRLAFTANLFADALPSGDVALQLELGGDVVCARIPAAAFERTRAGRRFRDERGTVERAGGIDRVRLRQRRRGQVELAAAAEPTPLMPGPGPLSLMVAVPDGNGMRCAATTVALRTGRKALRYP